MERFKTFARVQFDRPSVRQYISTRCGALKAIRHGEFAGATRARDRARTFSMSLDRLAPSLRLLSHPPEHVVKL